MSDNEDYEDIVVKFEFEEEVEETEEEFETEEVLEQPVSLTTMDLILIHKLIKAGCVPSDFE